VARPGARPRRVNLPEGRFSDRRDTWTVVNGFQVVLFVGENEPDDSSFKLDPDVQGEPHHLVFQFGGRKRAIVNLTSLTEKELDALQTVVNEAIDRARPVCIEQDLLAQRRYEEGDDSFATTLSTSS
jgi:hypothetical protein